MLAFGQLRPRAEAWTFQPRARVDLSPWANAVPCAFTLLSCVVALYLLFSPLGLVDGMSQWFWPLLAGLLIANLALLGLIND